MVSYVDATKKMEERAWKMVQELRIREIWESVGATVNLVGSLRMGLIAANRDVDFHIYTSPFRLSESFRAMGLLAEHPKVHTIHYVNLLEEEDRCISWQALCHDEIGEAWQIDMIHILEDSVYAGYFESVADRLLRRLTPETREAILRLKWDLFPKGQVRGIEVYRAVLDGGIRDKKSFLKWRETHPLEGICHWMP